MSELTTFTCDGCGAVKRAENKWWQLAANPGSRSYNVWPAEYLHDSVSYGTNEQRKWDFCGEGCLAAAEAKIRAGKALVACRAQQPEDPLERQAEAK